MTRVAVVVFACLFTFGTVRPEEDTEVVLQKPEVDVVKNGTEEELRLAWKKCFHKFSPGCVSVTLSQLASRLPAEGIRVAPGIRVVADSTGSSALLPAWSPLGLRLDPVDPTLLRRLTALTEELVDQLVSTENMEGRKKGGGGALLWSAGALAAVGFASLAAVAGKAMMASMMALMLAAMTALRGAGGGGGGGGGGHKSTVEIIKAPSHIELAPAHYETSQSYDHDHYYAAPSYEYGRTLGLPVKAQLPNRDSAASATAVYTKQTY